MKKRKPPIVLATCLVIMLLAVGIIYGQRPNTDDHGHEAPPQPAAEQGERPTMNTSQITSMTKGMMSQKGDPGKPPQRPGMPGEDDKTPSISVPKPQVYKPTPNDSSTSTQWYTDQTKK